MRIVRSAANLTGTLVLWWKGQAKFTSAALASNCAKILLTRKNCGGPWLSAIFAANSRGSLACSSTKEGVARGGRRKDPVPPHGSKGSARWQRRTVHCRKDV